MKESVTFLMFLDEGEDIQEMMGHFSPDRSPGYQEVRKAADRNSESVSSSCLMRAAPLAIWGRRLSDKELEDAITKELELSHKNKQAIQACICYALFIKNLITTNGDREDSIELVYQYARINGYNRVIELIDLSLKSKGTKVIDCTLDPESYENGFVWGFHLVNNDYSFSDALREILSQGGNTMANAAIVCCLMGAAVRLKNIPEQMKKALLTYRPAVNDKDISRPDWICPALKVMRLTNLVFWQAPEKLGDQKE